MFQKQKTEKTYTVEEAKRALEHFCVYQDRCHKEIEDKLTKMGMIPEACEVIILHLIEHNFLNEERFAKSYARGKFRIKKYGKVRITQELKFRNLSDYNIKTALKEIEEEVYLNTLNEIIHKKWEGTKDTDFYKKQKKVADFALRKGYESNLVFDVLRDFKK